MTETKVEMKDPIKKLENEEFALRPLNLKQDFEELIPFYDEIFEKELSAKGASVRAMLSEMKAFMPFFRFMGIFSKNFRHALDGFVYENSEGKIVSTVNVGYSGDFWEIAMVATHPDYRRRGLAKKLIYESIDHAKKHNAKMCVLEVLEENEPAYRLYRNLGFNHFDTRAKLKLESGKLSSISQQELPTGYSIQARKQDKKTSLEMYKLEEIATPQSVLDYLSVNKIKYQKPFIMRLLRPIVKLFIRMKSIRWTIHYQDKIVGVLFVSVGRSKDSCHDLDLIVDPAHNKEITQPLINYALNHIKSNTAFELNTITMIRKTDEHLLNSLKNFGFDIFETDHVLALKFNEN
ncbi:MAG: GNAT family N-acetyltransferase [Candidatus Heimdallarchaeota archaeon]|nr:GNAT family N-acetyltransferase [Candidatus Heimdallarchaeota archaeon]MBY8993156.1 GNAT family N-acetyltransferase [Candidatus Heimdallarchaeota archaeon]